jgi:hypothetical protein
VQVPDAHVVLEQVGDAALEAVELGQRVLADGDQEADRQVGAVDRLRELHREAALALVVRVVEEVLLELVEDDQQVQVPAGGPGRQPRRQATGRRQLLGGLLAERPRDFLADAVEQPRDGVARPPVHVRHQQPRRLLGALGPLLPAEVVDHPRPQDRALADPALPVDEGEPGRQQVGHQDRALGVAAEEPLGVLLGERLQALVRRRPRRRRRLVGWDRLPQQPTPLGWNRSTRSRSRAMYSSSDVTRTSTPRRCQNSSSIRLGSSWIAHDL